MLNFRSVGVLRHQANLFVFWFAVLVVMPAWAAPTYIQQLEQQLPANAQPQWFFTSTSDETLKVSGQTGAYKSQWLPSDGMVNSPILRIHTLKETEQAWHVVMHSWSNPQPIKKDQWVMVSFKTRLSPDATEGNIRGQVEVNKPSWLGITTVSFKATAQWQQVIGVARSPKNLDKNAAILSLHLGLGKQSIDIAELALVALASDVNENELPVTALQYDGMEAEAPWRNTAQTMIEQHRKGQLKLNVLNSDGQALLGAQVILQQRRNDYEFGSFVSNVLTNNAPIMNQYQQWFSYYFNVATTPVYWADWGWANPVRQQDYIDMASYFQQQQIPSRGHSLLYPGFRFSPQSLVSLRGDAQAFIAHINQHLEKVVPLFKQLGINEFDVINELRDEHDWAKVVGEDRWLDQVVAWFHLVHRLHPEAKLYINENSILTDGGNNIRQQDLYFELITTLLAKGAPLHGIGMQGHFTALVTPVEKLWTVLDRFATFKLPIRITEFDLSTRDAQGQAAYESDFYTAMLAHPATVGVTRWGFYQPQMWTPQGAMIDNQGQAKPNAKALHKLFSHTWNSSGQYLVDSQGKVEVQAFYGEYAVEVEHKGVRQQFIINFANPTTRKKELAQNEFKLVFQ
ncbi:endo-1,4-beta-xylanase [Paraglaciecola hydrolytica]|uniref:endo-1,4-beta-xylanase n=1 Tax=Paraglaciecola hydrolytica TaxID=1799789 RepID=A0A136A341_9ALTE|nr:endo-1,4-beta-xylanase [Paraglaciecola hydrolytica]KXI29655.1 hypothetical protein AX660_06310 [Paraglaciecola hydrolytica]